MNLLDNYLNIIYSLRRMIPKRIFKIISAIIKKKKIFNLFLCLPYGILPVSISTNEIYFIPLIRKTLSKPIKVLEISYIDLYWEVFINKSYEKYLKIKPGDIVLDIGANIGMFTIKAAKNAGEKGKVIAIEPEPNNVKILKENCRSFKNIKIIPYAVGNSSGQIELTIGIHTGGHYIEPDINKRANQKTISVHIEKIDNIVKNLKLDVIDFVKIDVEGWEIETLKGAINSLGKIKFFSIASYHTENEQIQITYFLKSRNFNVISDRDKTYAWNKKYL